VLHAELRDEFEGGRKVAVAKAVAGDGGDGQADEVRLGEVFRRGSGDRPGQSARSGGEGGGLKEMAAVYGGLRKGWPEVGDDSGSLSSTCWC
jgi:hypothetical protein